MHAAGTRVHHLGQLVCIGGFQFGQPPMLQDDPRQPVSLLGERAMPLVLGEEERDGIRRAWAQNTGAASGWTDRWRLVRIQRGLKVLGTFARLAASGAREYSLWMEALARDLSPVLSAVDAPRELVEIVGA